MSLLFDKALYGKPKDDAESVSSTITLLNSDMERIYLGLLQMHNTWACLIQVGVSTWLLARLLGLSAIACLLFCVCKCMYITRLRSLIYFDILTSQPANKACLVVGNITAVRGNKWLKKWLEAIQRRVNFTTRIVNQYRSVKMAGLSKILSTKLLRFRNEEIGISRTYRLYSVAIFGLCEFTTYVQMTYLQMEQNSLAKERYTSIFIKYRRPSPGIYNIRSLKDCTRVPHSDCQQSILCSHGIFAADSIRQYVYRGNARGGKCRGMF